VERFLPECLALFALFAPDLHAAIDWSRRFELLDKGLAKVAPKASRGLRVLDKPAPVWLKESGEGRRPLVAADERLIPGDSERADASTARSC
jgi:hypothetical protein